MKKIFLAATAAVVLASCSTTTRIMQEPNTRLNLNKNDFELSKQVTGEATVVRILFIDWARLFSAKSAQVNVKTSSWVTSIPVYGWIMSASEKSDYYAFYDMMQANPGYDVVLYPQVERKATCPILGWCGLFSHTKINATARLGKLKD